MQRNARISRSSIDEIILIGGSTRIPKIRELVQQFFHGKQISIDCNIDEISSKFFMIP
jgi:molecular chaperone DnaK (HSP70)